MRVTGIWRRGALPAAASAALACLALRRTRGALRSVIGVSRQQHGLEKKPAIVGNLAGVVQPFGHRPVVLPAVGKVDVVNHLAAYELHERALELGELIPAKAVAVIVQPLAPALDRSQADPADDPHRAGGQSEQSEQVRQMDPFLKRAESRSLIGQGPEPKRLATGEYYLQGPYVPKLGSIRSCWRSAL